MKYYIGCSGWKNQIWNNDFYPNNIDSRDFLSFYSKHFNFVHVNLNNAFIPVGQTTFQKWSDDTPEDFRFSFQMPQYVIEEGYDRNNLKKNSFLESLTPLKEKILCIVISTPNTMVLNDEGIMWIENMLNECSFYEYPIVFDFKHASWYQDLTYNILKRHNSAFVWSNLKYKYYYPVVTSNFLFLRLFENNFEKIDDIYKWIKLIDQKEQESILENNALNLTIIVVNNPSNINSIRNISNISEKKLNNSKNPSELLWPGKIIMHVDMNAFFPACEEIRDPSLVGKPHAVIMTPEKEGNITRGAVASCSYEARTYGVRSAMSLLKAKELCPHLILKPVDKRYYGQISDQVMTLLDEFADILEQASIDEAYLDCTNKILLFSPDQYSSNSEDHSFKKNGDVDSIPTNDVQMTCVENYALMIKNSIKTRCRGLVCSIGVASTKSAAKIASDYKKPDGLTIIPPQKLIQFLEPLEVNKISGIGSKTNQILKEMGIKTIDQLAKCNVQVLIDKFGKKIGLWMWNVSNGRDNDPVLPRDDNISISVEKTILKSLENKNVILEFLITEITDDLYTKIQTKGYEFKTVGIKLVRSDFGLETREITFSSYQNTKDSIINVLGSLLGKFQFDLLKETDNGINNKSGIPIRKLGIKVSNLSKINKKIKSNQKTLLDYMQ
ncbi:MAG TPA: DUF72 domain-containing protein [Candidatus Nitrosocosmicus sp.]